MRAKRVYPVHGVRLTMITEKSCRTAELQHATKHAVAFNSDKCLALKHGGGYDFSYLVAVDMLSITIATVTIRRCGVTF